MITKRMIKKGLKNGLINIVDSPNADGCVCEIGEYWFYFGGLTAEEMDAKTYLENVPKRDIIRELKDVLDEFIVEFPDEYRYYETCLRERRTA